MGLSFFICEMGIIIFIAAAQPRAQCVLRLNCSKIPDGVPGGGRRDGGRALSCD